MLHDYKFVFFFIKVIPHAKRVLNFPFVIQKKKKEKNYIRKSDELYFYILKFKNFSMQIVLSTNILNNAAFIFLTIVYYKCILLVLFLFFLFKTKRRRKH